MDASIIGDAAVEAASDASGAVDAADAAPAVAFQLAVGQGNTCALFPSARAKCWGQNWVGNGISYAGNAPGTMGANLPYLDFGGLDVRSIAANSQHVCAVFTSGNVRCFGNNTYGEIGPGGVAVLNPSLKDLPLPASRTVVEVALGWTHSCFRFDDGSVRCIGANDAGELGQGDTTARNDLSKTPAIALGTGRTAKAIAANGYFTCALLDDDRLKCWGSNSNSINGSGGIGGNLATGDNTARGDKPGQMGDALPYAALGFDSQSQPWKVKRVVLGSEDACAILSNDRLKCWGRNDGAVLGTGDSVSYGQTAQTINDAIPFLKLGTTNGMEVSVLDVAAGRAGEFCAIVQGGGVKCWGGRVLGVLGNGTSAGLAVGHVPAEMGDSLPFVALGTGRTAKQIRSNEYHVCAQLDDDSVKCWGFNVYGQLGLEDNVNRGDKPNQMGDLLPAVKLQ